MTGYPKCIHMSMNSNAQMRYQLPREEELLVLGVNLSLAL
jgi:hypothetical protein